MYNKILKIKILFTLHFPEHIPHLLTRCGTVQRITKIMPRLPLLFSEESFSSRSLFIKIWSCSSAGGFYILSSSSPSQCNHIWALLVPKWLTKPRFNVTRFQRSIFQSDVYKHLGEFGYWVGFVSIKFSLNILPTLCPFNPTQFPGVRRLAQNQGWINPLVDSVQKNGRYKKCSIAQLILY